MNIDVDKELRRLAKAERAIAQRDRKLAALQAEQEQARGESEAGKERLAMTILRRRGVFGLPAEQLATALSNLDIPAAAVRGAIIASASPLQAEASDLQKLPAASETIDVSVQISRNAAEAKRGLLTQAGMKWNGKAGRWIGRVDRRDLDELKAAFGERLTIKSGIEGVGRTAAATPAPNEERPAVAPAAADPSEGLPEACLAVPEVEADSSGHEAGDVVQESSPAALGGQPRSALPPVRPRMPMRPFLPRPAG